MIREGLSFGSHLEYFKDGADPHVARGLMFETTSRVLLAMREHGVNRLEVASTSAIYGELGGLLNENSGPLMPVITRHCFNIIY